MIDPLLVLAQALRGSPEEQRAAALALDEALAAERKRIADETREPEPDPGPYRDREGRLRDSAGVLIREAQPEAPKDTEAPSVLSTRKDA